MRPRESTMSSGSDDLWSVVSLTELSDDALNAAAGDDDIDDDLMTTASVVQAQPSTTTTATTKTKPVKTKPTKSVVKRNERERNRVKQVNQSFDRLRQYVRLPGLSKKKLSKVDTLRAAVVYIRHLQSLLSEADADAVASSQQLPPHHQPQQQQQQQQQQPDNAISPTSGFFFLSLLETGLNSPIETSYDATAATNPSFRGSTVNISDLQATTSTPAPCATYSAESRCLPLVDINDNSYVITEPCPLWSSQEAELSETAEQQRRLSELTAWLMQ